MLFGQSMFNFSGATNVLLFLIIRPQLLLFAPPENSAEPEAQISDANMGSVSVTRPDTTQCECNMETTRVGLVDGMEKPAWNFTFEGSRKSGAPSRVGSTQGSDGI